MLLDFPPHCEIPAVCQMLLQSARDCNEFYRLEISTLLTNSGGKYKLEYVRRALAASTLEIEITGHLASRSSESFYSGSDCQELDAHTSRGVCAIFIAEHESKISDLLADTILQRDALGLTDIGKLFHFFPKILLEISDKAISAVVTKALASRQQHDGKALVDAYSTTSPLLADLPPSEISSACLSAHRRIWRSELNKIGRSASIRIGEFCNRAVSEARRLATCPTDVFERIAQMAVILPDSDLFMEIYTAGLAKRLIISAGAKNEAEEALIGQLRLTCGKMLTAPAEGMLRDTAGWQKFPRINRSEENMEEFNVLICSPTAWPKLPMLAPSQNASWLPAEYASNLDGYAKAYSSIRESKKLLWAHSAGICVVRALEWKKSLSCSTCQMAVLLRFNDTETIPVQTHQDVIVAMSGLVKAKVLVECGDGKHMVNSTFTHPKSDIRIPFSSQASTDSAVTTDAEREKIDQSLTMDRICAAQACLTRIMKCHKSYTHSQLCADAIGQLTLRFTPDAYFIKKRIEELIDMCCIKRDEVDPKVYHYIA